MIDERAARIIRTLAEWLPAVAWAAVIFGFSTLHGSQVPGKYATEGHLIEYAVFGACLVFPLRRRRLVVMVLCAVLLASAYGITDELHQRFVPGRTPDVVDWATDTAGAAVGAGLAALLVARRRRKDAAARSDEVAVRRQ